MNFGFSAATGGEKANLDPKGEREQGGELLAGFLQKPRAAYRSREHQGPKKKYRLGLDLITS